MQDWIKRTIIVVVILGVIGGGIALGQKSAGAKKDEITYESAPAAVGDVKSFVTATGTIQPWKVVDVKSNVAGRLIRFGPADPRNPNGPKLDLGAHVREGQLLAVIDPTDTLTALDQAKADLEAATAKRGQAEVTVQYQKLQTEAKIASATKAVASARAKLAQAQFSATAQPQLTASQINQAKASLESARRAELQAEKNKNELEEELVQLQTVTIPLNNETVRTTLAQVKANMETAQQDYNRQRTLMGQGYVAKADVESSYARMSTSRPATSRRCSGRRRWSWRTPPPSAGSPRKSRPRRTTSTPRRRR